VNLAFDPVEHRYRLDGAEVPNVTRILAPMYDFSAVREDVLNHKRDIGIALHKAIELDLNDDLDEASIDEEVKGYFEGWKKFRRETGFECLLTEHRVASEQFRFAGTLDLAGLIDGVESLLDSKVTVALHPAVALQTSAYLRATSEMGLIRANARRYALRLKPNGTYTLDQFKDKNDFAVFLSALSLHNWKTRHGLAKEPQK
jgi:hypothetical protein